MSGSSGPWRAAPPSPGLEWACFESGCAGALTALVGLDGDPSMLEQAGQALAPGGEAVERALAELAALVRAVRARRPDVELHLDLAELRGYRYHTGFVFAAFVPGHGREVARRSPTWSARPGRTTLRCTMRSGRSDRTESV